MNKIAFIGDGKQSTGEKILNIFKNMGAGIDGVSGAHMAGFFYYIENNFCRCSPTAPQDYQILTIEQYESGQVPFDLTKILEGCEGVKLYCSVMGNVVLKEIDTTSNYPIKLKNNYDSSGLSKEGKWRNDFKDAECILFPSFENRDWTKFKKPIKFGTPIMTSNNGIHWKLKNYNESITQKYIVPVDKFDFTDFESNKY